MQGVRSKNTTPEIRLRKALHKLGYRYRLHSKHLPGSPDIVFPARKKVIFVHGCFWHFHAGCREGRIPNVRKEYWKPKLAATRKRDAKNITLLSEMGWKVLVVWNCELDHDSTLRRVQEFLDNSTGENQDSLS